MNSQTLADKLFDTILEEKTIQQIKTIIKNSKKQNLDQRGSYPQIDFYTPLMVAVIMQRSDIVKILLDEKVQPNELTKHYRYNYALTALDLALENLFKQKTSKENNKIVNLLIEHGAKKSDAIIQEGQMIHISENFEELPSKLQYLSKQKMSEQF